MSKNRTKKALRVFIVDDHHDIADGLAEVLRFHGHVVEVAYNGEQAVRVFREKDFDIAFMDVMMPGMNGVESFLAIRRIKPDARVVMMTGYSVEQLLDQVVEKGAYGVLHKPVSMDEVLATLDRVKSQGLVLIADASDKFGEMVQGVLEKNGFNTCTARTGKEALAKVLAGGVDILVLGESLPVLSGLEVYMELRKRARDIPTVIMTEGDHVSELQNVYKFESTGILTKPFNTEQLLDALGRLTPDLAPRAEDPPGDSDPKDIGSAEGSPMPEDPGVADSGAPAESADAGQAAPEISEAPEVAGSGVPETTDSEVNDSQPAGSGAAAPIQEQRAWAAQEEERREGRILAVDDDVDMVDGLAEVLRTQGYEVRTANTAAQANELAKEFDAEVALLDIRLGKTNGLELIASLKEARPDIYCVMITGNADKESAISAMKRGAYNYLTKPLHPDELFAVLDNCFDKYFLEQKMREAFLALQTAKETAEANSAMVLKCYGDISIRLDRLLRSTRDSSMAIVNEQWGPIGAEDYLDRARDVLGNISCVRGIMGISGDLVRAEIGMLEATEEEINICDTMLEASEAVKKDLGDARHEIEVTLPPSRPIVWGDARLLNLVAVNLIAGAVESAPAHGKVQVSVRCTDDDGMAIEVSHDGEAPVGGGEAGSRAPESEASRLRMSLIAHVVHLHDGVASGKVTGGRTKVRITLPAKRTMMEQDTEARSA